MGKKALVVVDVQNDFTEWGPFDPDGRSGWDAIARRIGAYTAHNRGQYDIVATTQDWHITPGDHFTKHPVHCMADSEGAELDPELDAGAEVPYRSLVDVITYKGRYADDYSGFLAVDDAGTPLPDLLRAAGVSVVDVCGFAADKCVAATVEDSAAAGFATTLLTDLAGVADPAGWDDVATRLRKVGVRVQASNL